jgi:hypothetical protein
MIGWYFIDVEIALATIVNGVLGKTRQVQTPGIV